MSNHRHETINPTPGKSGRRAVTTKNLLIAIALVAAAAGLAAIQTKATAQEQEQPERRATLNFGLMSLSRGQTVRLNLSSLLGPHVSPQIGAELMFIAADGSVLVARKVTLRPGESVSHDLLIDEVRSPQLRAKVRFSGPGDENNALDPDRFAVATVEVIDRAGRILLLNPVAIKGFDPQPEPPVQPAR